MGINIFNLFIRCLAKITLITDTSQKRDRWPKRDFTKRLQDSSTQATFSIPSFWVLYPRSSISQPTSLSLTGCKVQKIKQTNTSQIGKRRRVDRIRTGLCCDHGALHGHRHHWAHKDLGKQPRVSRSHPLFDYSRFYHKNRNTPKCLMIQHIVFQGALSF